MLFLILKLMCACGVSSPPADEQWNTFVDNLRRIQDVSCHYEIFSKPNPDRGMDESYGIAADDGLFLESKCDWRWQVHSDFHWLRREMFNGLEYPPHQWYTDVFSFDGKDGIIYSKDTYGGVMQGDPAGQFYANLSPASFMTEKMDLFALNNSGLVSKLSDNVYVVRSHDENKVATFYLDPQHGQMPKKITVAAATGITYSTFVVEEFIQVDGVWIPVVGTLDFMGRGFNRLVVDQSTLSIANGLGKDDFRVELPDDCDLADFRTGWRRRSDKAKSLVQEKASRSRRQPVPAINHFKTFWVGSAVVLIVTMVGGLVLYRKRPGTGLVAVIAVALFCSSLVGCFEDSSEVVYPADSVEISQEPF